MALLRRTAALGAKILRLVPWSGSPMSLLANVLLELGVDPLDDPQAALTKEDEWVRHSVNHARSLGL